MARRPVRAVVTVLAVVVVAVVAWFAGDAVARAVVQQQVRERIVGELALPADQQVDVDVAGWVIPQLVAGSLDELEIASNDVALDGVSGDVAATLQHVPVRGDDTTAVSGEATVSLGAESLRALVLSQADTSALGSDLTVALDEPDVSLGSEVSVLGASLPLALTARPGAADGDLTLTPESVRVGDLSLSVGDLAQAPVDLSSLSTPLSVCLADQLPAGLTLTGADVSGDRLVARFSLAPSLFTDGGIEDTGACS